MLIIPPPKFRRSRRPEPEVVRPAGAPVVLQSGTYDWTELNLILTFDRAIDISAFDPSQVTLRDGVHNGLTYMAYGPGQLSPNVIAVSLSETGSYYGDDVTVWATAMTGIVAVDDGGTWPGVSGFVV